VSPEHKGDSTSFSNPVVTRADFTYSIRLNRIKIVDLSTGKASVSSDIESVLRKIEAWHQSSIADYQIMYRDAEGYWDSVEWEANTPGSSRSWRPMKPRPRRSFWRQPAKQVKQKVAPPPLFKHFPFYQFHS